MTRETIFGIAALVLPVLTYFAGVLRTEQRHKKTDKKVRQSAVLSKYLDLRKTNSTSGLDGLQKSGISTLHSDLEIREVIELIVAHGEMHPLYVNVDAFKNINLKIFFDYAAANNISLLRTDYGKVIDESGA